LLQKLNRYHILWLNSGQILIRFATNSYFEDLFGCTQIQYFGQNILAFLLFASYFYRLSVLLSTGQKVTKNQSILKLQSILKKSNLTFGQTKPSKNVISNAKKL
jgi:hypothetical protein